MSETGSGAGMSQGLSASVSRREALKATTALIGGALFASSGILAACAREPRPAASVLSPHDQALAEEIADTLLPTTAASPGAKAAGAGAAMNLLLTDCYEREAQQRVVRGLAEFEAICRTRCDGGFAAMPRPQREALLRDMDAEARAAAGRHWFTELRELAERAYFSSEVGMTQALRYVEVPGRWVGCMPLKPGQPAWG